MARAVIRVTTTRSRVSNRDASSSSSGSGGRRGNPNRCPTCGRFTGKRGGGGSGQRTRKS